MSSDQRAVELSTVVPSTRQGGATRALLTPNSVGSTSGFLGVTDLGVGESVTEHYHPYSDKYLYVVDGEIEVELDGSFLAAQTNDAVFVRRGTRNRITNVGDGDARFVFAISPLAPDPSLGHIETEPVPDASAAPPKVGG